MSYFFPTFIFVSWIFKFWKCRRWIARSKELFISGRNNHVLGMGGVMGVIPPPCQNLAELCTGSPCTTPKYIPPPVLRLSTLYYAKYITPCTYTFLIFDFFAFLSNYMVVFWAGTPPEPIRCGARPERLVSPAQPRPAQRCQVVFDGLSMVFSVFLGGFLVVFGGFFWWFLVVFAGFWWGFLGVFLVAFVGFLVFSDGFWWVFSRWFLVVFDGFWWFLVGFCWFLMIFNCFWCCCFFW